MTQEFRDAVKVTDAEASFQERQLYQVQIAVKALIDFVVTSFEELGIEKLHELVDPSLDEVHEIKQKNPDLCAQSSKILKGAVIFK